MTDLSRARLMLDAELCRRNAHHFIFDSGALRSKDEHDPLNPVKPLPDVLYMRALLDLLCVSGDVMKPEDARYAREAGVSLPWLIHLAATRILFVEKSRQVMATWLTCAYLLWRARAYPNQLILVQSKREEDAASLVFVKEPAIARMSFMEDHLPTHLRRCQWPKHGAYGHLYVPHDRGEISHIWAIPEGSDIIRSNTASVVVSDEAAFQPEFSNAYTAALPAVKGGGQLVAISSAAPGAFCEIVEGLQTVA